MGAGDEGDHCRTNTGASAEPPGGPLQAQRDVVVHVIFRRASGHARPPLLPRRCQNSVFTLRKDSHLYLSLQSILELRPKTIDTKTARFWFCLEAIFHEPLDGQRVFGDGRWSVSQKGISHSQRFFGPCYGHIKLPLQVVRI